MLRKTPAVFFDRDGTIMRDVNYCSQPGDVHVFPNVYESLRKLKDAGFKLIMITNQSGIGRGYFTREQYETVHAEVLSQIASQSSAFASADHHNAKATAGLIDATYVCPDPPGIDSACRKPAPGMILEGAREHHIDLQRSVMIGDKEIDVHCAHNAGIKAIRVRTGFETNTADSSADWIADDFAQATHIVLTEFAS
jgi:histidinol-phosphate phosphatase family protein